MGLSLYEKETILNFNEEEKTATVYTHNRALRHKLEKLAIERPEDCHLQKVSSDEKAVEYLIPKAWIHIRPPRKYSEAQLEAMRARLKNRN